MEWKEVKNQMKEDKKRIKEWIKGHRKFVLDGELEENHLWFKNKKITSQKELKKEIDEIFDFLEEVIDLEEKEVVNCGNAAEHYVLTLSDDSAKFEYVSFLKWGGYYYKQTKQITITKI